MTDLATGKGSMTTCKPDQVEETKQKLFNGYFHISTAVKKRKSK